MTIFRLHSVSVLCVLVIGLHAAEVSGPQPVVSFTRQADSVTFTLKTGLVKIQVCSDRIVHVQAVADQTLPTAASVPVIATWKSVPFTVQDGPDALTLTTGALQVRVDKLTGAVAFLDAKGGVVLAEGERRFTTSPASIATKDPGLGQVEQAFATQVDESLHGLGQFQDGIWNFRGIPLELRQHNTVIALPMLVSSKGYGVLWDNASLTHINPIDPIDQTIALSATGEDHGTGPKATEELDQATVKPKTKAGDRIRTGTFTTTTAGDYVFMVTDGDRRDRLELTVDGQLIAGFQNRWVPYSASGSLALPANTTVPVMLQGGGKSAKVLAQRRQNDRTVFRSQVGAGVDYWFIYGPDPSQVVAGYRTATGDAPMWPKWAFGFWQCRERYRSSKELLDTITEFRRQRLPVDLIVQDWQYWGKHGWSACQWDEQKYPDPKALCDGLHALHAHLMLSIWPNLSGQASETMAKLPHGFIPNTKIYDATSAEARTTRWELLNQAFFAPGVDAWWQDGAEPLDDGNGLEGNSTAIGPGSLYRNAYPLFHNRCVYDGQRATNPDKRVVTLTRSAYPGQQRYAAATWSGDINGTWDSFRRQIPAGLNVSITGQPYWTTDCGGFFHPDDQHQSADYNELWTRWFQFSTLCPIQRVHGFISETEVWKWLPRTQEVMRAFLDLRYRLLPYIYSQAWAVTHDQATLMRPLVLDFPNDVRARDVGDQYLFGPALLVSPVTTAQATSRSVYLPGGTTWFDFWSGETLVGGREVVCPTPIDQLPIQVRAGSILPLGPTLQWADEKPADPIELRIYPGTDGSFTLYEDEGDSYRYEQGAYATIPIAWNDAARTFTIGTRSGSFPGMLMKRTFQVVIVHPGHGLGIAATTTPDQTVTYSGETLTMAINLTP